MEIDLVLAALGQPLLSIGGTTVTRGIGLALSIGAVLLVSLLWNATARRAGLARERAVGADLEDRFGALMRSQAEITGRMQTMAEIFGTRQADLARTLAERLDGVSAQVGQSVTDSSRRTQDSLSTLGERLAVIDSAQARITDLAGEVVRLQDILADKQTRGAFGQGRMESIVMDALPPGAFSFQATLSNGKRPDCLIAMPNGAPALVIDAKFPLESWSAFHAAEDEAHRLFAAGRFRRDMDAHIRAIAERYLLPGETQDTAFLFVPSESIFADLGKHFQDIVQKAHRARVIIVSPTLLMLSIQVVQSILKDARMREEAGRIQEEVRFLTGDLARLDARVAALKTHFSQGARDIDQILVSTEKLMRRGERIEAADLGPRSRPAGEPCDAPEAEGPQISFGQ